MPLLGVHLTKGLPDPKADQMSSWPDVVPLLATRCCYQGVHLSKGQPDPKIWQKMSTWPKASSVGRSIWLKCKKDIWKLEHTLHFMLYFTEVFSMKDQLEKVDKSQTHLTEFTYNLVWGTNPNEENRLICDWYLIRIGWDRFMKTGDFDWCMFLYSIACQIIIGNKKT